jgi:hypothetical protein
MDAHRTRRKQKPPAPRLKVSVNDDVSQISIAHPDPATAQILLMEALGTTDADFLDGLLGQLAAAGTQKTW